MKKTFCIIIFVSLLTSVLAPAFSTPMIGTEPSTMTFPSGNPTTQKNIYVASQEPPPTEWSKTYGGTGDDWAMALIQTTDGGYALAGWTNSSGAGTHDAWLVKTDADGNAQWNKTYGGTSDEWADALVETTDGGFALAGATNSSGAGGYDFWLVKTDASGNMQWNKTYGGTSDDYAFALVQTVDGGYALAGTTESYGAGLLDFWLVKTDVNGNAQWNKTYGEPWYDEAWTLVQTGDGGYALAGTATSDVGSGADFWLVKTDASGNAQWNKTYRGRGGWYDSAQALVHTSDGGYALAGTQSSGAGDDVAWLVKTDADGNAQWNKTYGGTSDDDAYALVQTRDGGYALAGHTMFNGSYDFWLVRTDAYGNVQWEKKGGDMPSGAAYSVIQTNDGGYALAGHVWLFSPFDCQFGLVKIAAHAKTGSYLWASANPLSDSSFGNVPVSTHYYSDFSGRDFYGLVCIPENMYIDIWCKGHLYDSQNKPIEGKEVKLLIDNAVVSSYLTTAETYNANWTVKLNLTKGLHNGELRFDGDTEFLASSYKFTILAYKDSHFNMTRDAFSFVNWPFSFDEFTKLVQKLSKENVIDRTMEVSLLILYPLVSSGGHCFGMAAGSSAYYFNPSLKPRSIDTYALSVDDAFWDINWYQLCQVKWIGSEASIASSLSGMKSLLDSGTPVVLSIREAKHAITIAGYYEGSDETFLVAYDNNQPNSTVVYSVKDGKLMYGSTNVTQAVFIDPKTLPSPYNPLTELLKEIFKRYLGLQINSPVNVKITSATGKELLIENNTVIRNDISDSYVYLAESKMILLPSSENYTMEATGTEDGQVSLDCVFASGDEIIVHQSPNITISNGSKLHLPSLQSESLYIDSDGDGTIDQTITIPELPLSSILSLLMIVTLLGVIVHRRRCVTAP